LRALFRIYDVGLQVPEWTVNPGWVCWAEQRADQVEWERVRDENSWIEW
jgi:hypothetical protein